MCRNVVVTVMCAPSVNGRAEKPAQPVSWRLGRLRDLPDGARCNRIRGSEACEGGCPPCAVGGLEGDSQCQRSQYRLVLGERGGKSERTVANCGRSWGGV